MDKIRLNKIKASTPYIHIHTLSLSPRGDYLQLISEGMWFFKNFFSFLQQLSFFVYIAWVFCQIIQKIFIFNWIIGVHSYLLGIFEQYSVWRIFWDENFLCCWLKKKVRAFRGIKYCLFQYEKPRDTQNMGKKSRYFSEIWPPKSRWGLPRIENRISCQWVSSQINRDF